MTETYNRIIVERQTNGYLVTLADLPDKYEQISVGGGESYRFLGGTRWIAADRDELADLVRRLMAEPTEGRTP